MIRALNLCSLMLVCGSREYGNVGAVRGFVQGLPQATVVIAGDASGPDTWAIFEARRRQMATMVLSPAWYHGLAAGAERNDWLVRVVEAFGGDRCTAFWDGESNGTWDTVTRAARVGFDVTVYRPDGASRTFAPKHVDLALPFVREEKI
jgi:hypothetical protein